MLASRMGAALAVGAVMGLGAAGSASAADLKPLPTKAPPPITPFVLDVHGFVDVTFKNTNVTPRGLMVRETSGLTTQVANGLALDVYKDTSGFISGVSFYAGTWNDLWSEQHDPVVKSWAEFDWWVGMSVKFAQHWKFTVEYIAFLSPTTVTTSFPATEHNIEFGLFYDDSHWGLPIVFNPYVKLFYAVSGPSTVVLGKRGDTYDIEIGMVPTVSFAKNGLPVVDLGADLDHRRPGGILEPQRRHDQLLRSGVERTLRAQGRRRGLYRLDGEVHARPGDLEAARHLVRQGRLPVLPHPQRSAAWRASAHRRRRRRDPASRARSRMRIRTS